MFHLLYTCTDSICQHWQRWKTYFTSLKCFTYCKMKPYHLKSEFNQPCFFFLKYPVATHVCCTSTHHTAQNLKMWFFLYFLWATNDTFLTWSPLRGNTKRPRIYLLFVLSQHHDTNSLNENWTFKEMYVIIFLRYWNLHVVLQIRFCAKKINVQ